MVWLEEVGEERMQLPVRYTLFLSARKAISGYQSAWEQAGRRTQSRDSDCSSPLWSEQMAELREQNRHLQAEHTRLLALVERILPAAVSSSELPIGVPVEDEFLAAELSRLEEQGRGTDWNQFRKERENWR
ncbi:MAG: hypothetical protein KF760_25595 [Candidatus Eremiobacteraeota bacterium]|nr:hypothetical protein [Candidatus Eremiobacteraeota bacterium]